MLCAGSSGFLTWNSSSGGEYNERNRKHKRGDISLLEETTKDTDPTKKSVLVTGAFMEKLPQSWADFIMRKREMKTSTH